MKKTRLMPLYKKEMASLFYTGTGYTFLFFMLLFYGVFFSIQNLSVNSGAFNETVSTVSYLFLLSIPIITMKNDKNDADPAALTSLYSTALKTVCRFLAILTLFAISLVVLTLFPLFIMANGGGDILLAISSILGLLLFGAFLISIGSTISFFAPTKTVSAAISFTILVILYFSGMVAAVIPKDETVNLFIALFITTLLMGAFYMYTRLPLFTFILSSILLLAIAITYFIAPESFYGLIYKFFSYFSVTRGFYLMNSGLISFETVFFYLSSTALILSIPQMLSEKGGISEKRVLPRHRSSIRRSNKNVSLYAALICLLTTASVMGLCLLCNGIPLLSSPVDMTAQRYHSLSRDGERYLSRVNSKVIIYHLSSVTEKDEELESWLSAIEKCSENIEVVFCNVNTYPDFYTSFTDSQPSENSLIIIGENGSTIIRNEDLYLYGITFMDNEIANGVNYDTAAYTVSAYREAYLEDYSVDISGYIAYYPTHYAREKVMLQAVSDSTGRPLGFDISKAEAISILPPKTDLTSVKIGVYSVVFTIVLPVIPLIFGAVIVNARKKGGLKK